MKKLLPLVGLVLLAGCGQSSNEYVSIDNYVKTYTVHTGYVSSNNKYVGVLQSNQTTYLGFKLPGRITNLYVKEGDAVKK
jgi:multidrug efflux pump subunit AcrA (membrane-fusion protein)